MKSHSTLAAALLACLSAVAAAQTGTVPLDSGTAPSGMTNSNITEVNGNVGIGTTSTPAFTLDVNGPARATGLVSEASVTTTWSSYVNTNISTSGQSIISVFVSGGNSTWAGVFLVQGNNSYTPNAAWNNTQLISWSGYNSSVNDVQALIMSNSATNNYGGAYLVIQINGGADADLACPHFPHTNNTQLAAAEAVGK